MLKATHMSIHEHSNSLSAAKRTGSPAVDFEPLERRVECFGARFGRFLQCRLERRLLHALQETREADLSCDANGVSCILELHRLEQRVHSLLELRRRQPPLLRDASHVHRVERFARLGLCFQIGLLA